MHEFKDDWAFYVWYGVAMYALGFVIGGACVAILTGAGVI